MAFETTALYALPMALLGLILWFRVTLMRASLKVSIGDASHPARYIGNTASLRALLNVMGCLLVTSFGL